MPLLYPEVLGIRPTEANGTTSPLPFWWGLSLTLLFLAGYLLPDIRVFERTADYLSIHNGLEFISLAVSWMLFGLGWSLQDARYNSRSVLLSAAFLYVGIVDFAHVLSFPGMPDLGTPASLEKAINFWLAGRLGAAIGILGILLLPINHWSITRSRAVFGLAFAIAAATVWLGVFHADALPRTYIRGEGLTPFKIGVEWLLAMVYGAAGIVLYRRGKVERDDCSLWMGIGIWGLALTELLFSDFLAETDLSNLLGHIFKVVSYWMIYHAIFDAGVKLPYRALSQREEELKASNEALLRSNMELQRFAHAAAHDLQTPLRSIAGFAQLAQRELGGRAGGQVEEWLGYVVDNTLRLHVLIQDMLAYTHLNAKARPFEETDLNRLFQDVLAALSPLVTEMEAEVRCSELPVLKVDRSQIAQILEHLVENGIKYNDSKPPVVSIGCERRGESWLFWVTDNGVGIDPRHHARIFQIFQRLHSYSQIPGTGIGLAVCQRIVERHGGRLWVESAPGRGSTFYFTLADRRQDKESPS